MPIKPDDLKRLDKCTLAEVAQELNVTPAAIWKAYRRFGIERHPRPRRRASPKSSHIPESWLRSHPRWTARSCAVAWGVCEATILRLRRKYGIKWERTWSIAQEDLERVNDLTAGEAAQVLHRTVWQVRYWRKKYWLSGRGVGKHR